MAAADVELMQKVCIKLIEFHLTGYFPLQTHTYRRGFRAQIILIPNCIEKQQRNLFIQRVVFKCTSMDVKMH